MTLPLIINVSFLVYVVITIYNNTTAKTREPQKIDDVDIIKMSKRTQWHRVLGLVLEPVFKELGYDVRIEDDLSLKKQIVDIVVIRKSKDLLKGTTLPKIFWEVFEDFNEHNLISFKSYSESFTSHACEELYGHLTNYKKINKLKGHEVNLYVIAQHYPQKFLSPYEGSKFLKTIKKDKIFDLALGSLLLILPISESISEITFFSSKIFSTFSALLLFILSEVLRIIIDSFIDSRMSLRISLEFDRPT